MQTCPRTPRRSPCALFLAGWMALLVPPAMPATEFDLRVREVVVDVTLEPETSSFRARASLTLEGKGVERVVFEVGEPFAVERVSSGAGVVEYRKRGGQVVADLDPPLDGTRVLTFVVSGTPRLRGEARIRADRAVLAPEDGWIPTHPGMWATSDVTVRVPAGWTAVGPGRRERMAPEEGWRWKSERPVRSIAVAAAPGLDLEETTRGPLTVRRAGPSRGLSVEDLAARVFPAVAWHSGAFAPYPFDGLNVVFLPGVDTRTRGSGIVVAPTTLPLANDADGAELVSGQWLGEWLAGDGAWMEAWGAWEPVVFARDRALPLPAETVRQREAYFRLLSGDVALSAAGPATPEAVTRGKGSAAPDMVRLCMGDRPFFTAVRGLFEQPVGPRMSLSAFRERFVKESPEHAGPAFEDWFGKPGVPEITATLRTMPTTDEQWRTDVLLVQERGLYRLPVEIVFHGEDGSEKRETVEIDDAKTPLVYVLPFRALRVEVDPLGRIFGWR